MVSRFLIRSLETSGSPRHWGNSQGWSGLKYVVNWGFRMGLLKLVESDMGFNFFCLLTWQTRVRGSRWMDEQGTEVKVTNRNGNRNRRYYKLEDQVDSRGRQSGSPAVAGSEVVLELCCVVRAVLSSLLFQ